MKLFEMKEYNLQVSEEAWGYIPFKKLLERDKSKEKEKAFKDILFVWNFCDIRSNYTYIANEEDRIEEIKKDIGLPKNWKFDKEIKDAINFYNKFNTINERLYRDSIKAANAISEYLSKTEELLKERNIQGNYVTDISKITTALSKIPKLMSDLKTAYKEVVKEKEDLQGKKKGSKEFNLYEDGLGE